LNKYSLEAFMSACGATRPLLLDIDGSAGGADLRRALQQPFAVVGRLASADLPLKDPRVHRRHTYLQVIAGQVYCVDLDGTSGAPEGGEPGPRWLLEKQAIRIGRQNVRLLRGPAPAPTATLSGVNPLASGSATQLGISPVLLEFLRGDSVRLRWRLDRLLALVGSSSDCKVRITAGKLARFQCSLVLTPGGLWIVDLLGREGICLNGVRSRYALVEDGDLLQLGTLSIRLRYESPKLAAVPPSGYLEDGTAAPGTPALSKSAQESASPAVPPLPGPALPPCPVILPPFAEVLPTPPLEGQGQALARPRDFQEQGIGAFVFPLLNQFNAMQQQMFDQFQQAVLQMFQMFSTLHKDQAGLLREEIERQNQLNRELRDVQAELSKLQASGGKPVAGTDTDSSASPATRHAPPASRPAQPTFPPREKDNVPAASQGAPTAGLGETAARAGETPKRNGEDVHAWLCRRMETLQQERQTGWRRIMNFLVGKRPEDTVL